MPHPTDQFTPSGYDAEDNEQVVETRDLDAELVTRELAHEFQIVRLLGRGAMGSVYLARDLALHRVVAIKVLRWDLAGSLDDGAIPARGTHHGSARIRIVPLHNFGESPNLMYMVMRYVPGESLGTRIRRLGKLDPEETRRILAELALTLEYAHREGIGTRSQAGEHPARDRGDLIRPMVADLAWRCVPRTTRLRASASKLRNAPLMSPEQAAARSTSTAQRHLLARRPGLSDASGQPHTAATRAADLRPARRRHRRCVSPRPMHRAISSRRSSDASSRRLTIDSVTRATCTPRSRHARRPAPHLASAQEGARRDAKGRELPAGGDSSRRAWPVRG
jgi:hypothetical protein